MASSLRKTQSKTSNRKSQTLINSPIVKRVQSRPVALQGWLLKRGSDGLMLWKKRWFVLSDYCLFYYKDTLEEKLLGSLVLASYKISQCSPDEKGYKKFSFKAEHTNMRTYYFAAENQVVMEQWIKAMTLASLLEESISDERLSLDAVQGYNRQSKRFDYISTPKDNGALSGLRTPDPQPVYANAPPKPKRLNESSSPECSSDMQYREDNFQNYQNHSYPVIYNNISPGHPYNSTPPKKEFVQYERNTCDTYGRKISSQSLRKKSNQTSPSHTTHGTIPMNISKESSNNSKNVSFSFPPRPHSVDFLEYAGKNSSDISQESSEKHKLHLRPKSSLSTVNTYDDDTWTAEEYARRMRQSSLYVKPPTKHTLSNKNDSGSTSSTSHSSNINFERPNLENDFGPKSGRVPGVLYRTKNMTIIDNESKFFRSASARLFRPMSDCHDEFLLQNASGPPANLISENTMENKEAANKTYQREQAMKRLLEWKNRMTHSSLRKPQNKSYLPDRHSSYIIPTKNDTYQSGSISSSTSRNENVNGSGTSSNNGSKSPEKLPNSFPCQTENESRMSVHPSSPIGTFFQMSSDDDGLDGSDSKYGFSGSKLDNHITERSCRQIMVDENNKVLDEHNNVHQKLDHVEQQSQMRIPNGLGYSADRIFSNLKSNSNSFNNLDLSPNIHSRTINIQEDENLKNKLVNNSLNTQDLNKKINMPQSTTNERDEEWGIKLDESRVIKEFSYHYITTEKPNDSLSKIEVDSLSNFSYKNKKTNQDFPEGQGSRQNSSNPQSRNDLKTISFYDPPKQMDSKPVKKESSMFQKISGKGQKKSNKGFIITKGSSVRTYRKDPNKLNPKVNDNKIVRVNNNTDRRLVQSDSEALLYDTSSDVEEKVVFNQDPLEKLGTSSDDDRDEEVVAVLSKENIYIGPDFNSVKLPYRNCKSTEVELPGQASLHSKDLKKEGNNEQTSYLINHEKKLSTSTDVNSDAPEENYMPMTPRKKSHSSKPELTHSRSNSASHTLIIENLLGSSEESPYVEMTQKVSRNSGYPTGRSCHNNESDTNNESYSSHIDADRYCEIGKNKDIQYEMIYNATSQEPLYMEVPLVKEKDSEKKSLTLLSDSANTQDLSKRNTSKENLKSSRPSLPDILNTTAPTINQGSGRSDSSDADDEASKDLDSLDAPRHPRFSLSDTFRPASYYLGASLGDRTIISINNENQDSSDSDLVSPPPIPTSSPPLDDLETSIDSTTVNKEFPLPILKSDSNNIYSNDLFLQSNANDLVAPYKKKNPMINSNSNLYETSSEESVNYEKREQRLKRRPLSADILSSLQDINFIIPPSGNDMKNNPITDHVKLTSDFEEDQITPEPSNLLSFKLTKEKHKKIDNFLANKEEAANEDSENYSRYKNHRYPGHDPAVYYSRILNSPPMPDAHGQHNQYENLPVSNNDYKYFDKYNCKENSDSFENKVLHSKENKHTFPLPNENQNAAPYYYSDLLKIDSKNFYEFNKNRWEEPAHGNEKNCPPLSTEKVMSKVNNYNQYSDPVTPKIKPILNEKFKGHKVSDNYQQESNNSSKIIKEPLDYKRYYMSKESTSSKIFHPLQDPSDLLVPQRTRSLEGLIDNNPNSSRINGDINITPPAVFKSQSHKMLHEKHNSTISKNQCSPNQDIWEEDTLWRENLRKLSIRHTRSLEDLDRKDCSSHMLSSSPNVIGETKTYENIRIQCMPEDTSEKCSKGNDEPSNILLQKHGENNCPNNFDDESKQKNNNGPKKDSIYGNNTSFEIDREKLRQWDLMSSAPAMLSSNRAVIKPITERKQIFPQSIPGIHSQPESQSEENHASPTEIDNTEKQSTANMSGPLLSQEPGQGQALNLKVSAGELLGRTHEELVLLLIQLRRQRATVCQSMEKCHREIETKACLADLDKANRAEHLKKLDELKVKLTELEKQYEKGKPLVNLVDNMVKLGSLYQAGSPQKLEFIQRIQEQRLLAEEKRDWERIRPDHNELKAKVERLYRLDKQLQEESGTLHSLQQDKGVLERALGGLKTKLQGIHGNSPESEWYRRQQKHLEKELSRVRSILAVNSKKLEETVAENARLEQELVVLRQKLQLSRRSAEPGSSNTAALEAELRRVQLLVGNLLRQRQELSLQVRQLTEKSNSLSRQIWHNSCDNFAEGVSTGKKSLSSGWIETDLDADVSTDVSNPPSICSTNRHQHTYISPLYVNTANRDNIHDYNYQDDLYDGSPLSTRSPECSRISESNDDDILRQSYGLQLKDKPQEIKTVRIVKRESERRQRDRDRSGNIGIPITYTNPKRPITDDRFSDKIKSEKDLDMATAEYRSSEPPPTPGPRNDSFNAVWNLVQKNKMKGKLVTRNNYEKGDSGVPQLESPQLSPVYLSETARKIVEEVAWQGMSEKRLVPKEKRRHHTMSGPSLIAPQNIFSQMGSRDDLDIERVLRPRLTTPDVVRSTLIRDPHYTKETIDNILGAPGKILIPERYIPETQPQLTKEEQNKRSKKADAIRKMLSETTAVTPKESDAEGVEKVSSLKRKVAEEKKNREHLLQLSQILAQQVMEKSKLVAGVNPTPVE